MSTQATTRVLAIAGAAAMSAILLAGPAHAQQPLSRAEVQQQTLAAIESGDMLAAGEGSPRADDATIASGKTRAERKAETLEAARQHKLLPAGEAISPRS